MAKKTEGKQTESIIIQQIEIKQLARGINDIATWRNALRAAENPKKPNRLLLYTLYAEMMLDGHLKAVYKKRRNAIIKTKIEFVKPGEKTTNEDVLKIIERSWFIEMLKIMIDTTAWGHSLIEFLPDPMDPSLGPGKAVLIPRRHVVPELGYIAKKQGDASGIPFREPPTSNYVIEVGEVNDFGYLLEAAQYVIYKRGGFGDWAQFAEIFGMPFRKGKYNPNDPKSREILIESLDAAGSAAYAVYPEGTDVEFVNNTSNNSSSNVYSGLIEMCNRELSKIVLGNTMTTEDGSSESQANVHANVEEELNQADRQWIEFLLNDYVKPMLVNTFGLSIFSDGRFKFDDAEDLDTQLDRELKIAQHFEIDPTYFKDKYNLPILGAKTGGVVGGNEPKK